MDHTVDSIRFDHPSIGEVTVRQDLGLAGEDRDATARLCWDAAFPMAQFLCENPTLVKGRDVVELGAGPGLPGVVAAKLGASRVTLTDLPSELELLEPTRLWMALEMIQARRRLHPPSTSRRVRGATRRRFRGWVRGTWWCVPMFYTVTARMWPGRWRRPCGRWSMMTDPSGGVLQREKLMHDLAFFEEAPLFRDPTHLTVAGVAEEDKEDLWFFEYRPK